MGEPCWLFGGYLSDEQYRANMTETTRIEIAKLQEMVTMSLSHLIRGGDISGGDTSAAAPDIHELLTRWGGVEDDVSSSDSEYVEESESELDDYEDTDEDTGEDTTDDEDCEKGGGGEVVNVPRVRCARQLFMDETFVPGANNGTCPGRQVDMGHSSEDLEILGALDQLNRQDRT